MMPAAGMTAHIWWISSAVWRGEQSTASGSSVQHSTAPVQHSTAPVQRHAAPVCSGVGGNHMCRCLVLREYSVPGAEGQLGNLSNRNHSKHITTLLLYNSKSYGTILTSKF